MTTTVINVPPGVGQQQQQQPIVIQQPGGQQPIVLPAQVLQQVNNVQQQNSQIPSRYNAQAGLVTGILQGLAAIVTIVCTIFALTYGTEYRFGWGIWAGVLLYGPAGILGIASKGGHRGVIIGYLVLSILSSLSAPMQMIYDSVAASKGGHMGYNCYDYYDYYYGCIQKDFNHTLQALHAVSAVTMFCEMIIAIVAASYCCCSGICACGTSGGAASSTQTIVVQHQQNPGAPLITYNQPSVQPQQIPYHPPPYQQQPPYQQPPPQQPPQQQPPYQQLNSTQPSQPSAYTALNFEQPGGTAPSAPAGPPPAYESSIRAVPTENAENTYMEVIQ